jgi:hypothetical protein
VRRLLRCHDQAAVCLLNHGVIGYLRALSRLNASNPGDTIGR